MVEILHEYWPRLVRRITQARGALESPVDEDATDQALRALREVCLSAEFLGLEPILPLIYALEDACAAAGPRSKTWSGQHRANILSALAGLDRAVSETVDPDSVLAADETVADETVADETVAHETVAGEDSPPATDRADAPAASLKNETIQEIPIDRIEFNGRLHRTYMDKIHTLASSVSDPDMRPPVLVVPKGPDQWLLVSGMLRFGIARERGWPVIPAVVMDENRVPEALWTSDENLLQEEFYQLEHAHHHVTSPPLKDQMAKAGISNRPDRTQVTTPIQADPPAGAPELRRRAG